jgi:ribosome maturation factor RimP
MAMASKAEVIRKIVEPVVEALGYQLWGLEYLGQGRHTLLRIFIDKAGGINIEDCAEASRQISSILDVEDPIKDEYTLEVSSPGLDRILFRPEQFRDYIGSTVKIRLGANQDGRRNFTGILKEVVQQEGGSEGESSVVITMGAEEITLPFAAIEKANLVS